MTYRTVHARVRDSDGPVSSSGLRAHRRSFHMDGHSSDASAEQKAAMKVDSTWSKILTA